MLLWGIWLSFHEKDILNNLKQESNMTASKLGVISFQVKVLPAHSLHNQNLH